MKSNTVLEGYYYEDSGFTTRYNDYASITTPPGLEDEDIDYEVYMTADGKFFGNYDKAKKHAETLNIPELDEVNELLEKVKILCETHKDKSPLLASVKSVIKEMESDAGSEMLDKYYDSTCW